MKQLINLLLVIASLLSSTLLFSQGIKPGQKMPFHQSFEEININSSDLQLSEFKGKNIIIEFWGSNCISCIQSFPALELLQQKYGDKLQIILATVQNKKVIEDFFSRRKSIKKPTSIAMIVNGQFLFDLVPRDEFYYSIWIDANGILRYVTDSYNINEPNIYQFINGENPDIEQLPEPGNQVIHTSSFNESLSSSTELFSFIGKCSDNLRLPNYTFRKRENLITLSSNCTSILNLFIQAYSEKGKNRINPSNIVIDIPDDYGIEPSKDPLKYKEWQSNFSYTYELKVHISREGDFYQLMQEDLRRFFRLEFIIDTIEKECLVLEIQDSAKLPLTKGGVSTNTLLNGGLLNTFEDTVLSFTNNQFDKFSNTLKNQIEYNLGVYFIDETGYHRNVDIVLSSKCLFPINEFVLTDQLKKYGLRLAREKRSVQVFKLIKTKE